MKLSPASRDHPAVGDAAAGGRIAKDGDPGKDHATCDLAVILPLLLMPPEKLE